MAITIRRDKANKPRYRVRVCDRAGVYYPTKTFSTLRDARSYEHKLKDQKERQEGALCSSIRNRTVSEYFEEWLEYRKGAISFGWYERVEQISRDHILPFLGHRKLSEVSSPLIGRVLFEAKKKKLKPQSQLHVFGVLSKAFKDCVEYYGYLSKTPVLRQDKPKLLKVESDYLTPKESFKLLETCKDHYLGLAIWVSMLSGLRPFEVQALQWKSVDFEKKQITVCAAYKRALKKIEFHPKQKDWLVLPMPRMLIDYLLEQKKRFPLGFVAAASRGGMLEYKKLYNGLKKLCEEAGVKSISPQKLRHSCTEIWCQKGASLEDIRRLLGHKSAQTTRRYIHKSSDRLIALAKEITMPT